MAVRQGPLDPLADVVSDGRIDHYDINEFVSEYVDYNAKYPDVFQIPDHPIAYSELLEFDVPQRQSSDTVWDYILIRFYAPQNLAESGDFYVVMANGGGGAIRNIQVDHQTKDSSIHNEPYPNLPVGPQTQGYHLLILEYREPTNGGYISIGIGNSGGTAQLDRTRIQIPNYSSSQVGYTITTQTTFSQYSDYYFLKGTTSRCIDSIGLGGGTLWPEWIWITPDTGNPIYGWGRRIFVPTRNHPNFFSMQLHFPKHRLRIHRLPVRFRTKPRRTYRTTKILRLREHTKRLQSGNTKSGKALWWFSMAI